MTKDEVMDLERLTLEEYQKSISSKKTYLEECLENGTAEYYIINYSGKQHQFFFYKQDFIADICVEEKSDDSLFDYAEVMNEIFSFLKKKGFKGVRITLSNDFFVKRNDLARKYGFKEVGREEIAERNFIHYERKL